ncbi:MAG: DUF1836 domain-containing protein [Clostridia bacterium]|nr:DUF1836 domain-containing protein [Clostridia bacterium]
MEYIPGTVLKREDFPKGLFAAHSPLISLAGGLTLSQVCEITGLEGPAVQNWIKRGFVAKTVLSRYRERQLSRILIINALRQAMRIDSIVSLLKYLNGSVEDPRDDIIPETRLYDYLCRVMAQWVENRVLSLDALDGVIDGIIAGYRGCDEWKNRLKKALKIMSLACASVRLRGLSEELYLETLG